MTVGNSHPDVALISQAPNASHSLPLEMFDAHDSIVQVSCK